MSKIKYSFIICSFIFLGLYACKNNQEPQTTATPIVSISIESDLEEEDIPNSLRALIFKGGKNKNNEHPSIALKKDVDSISSTLLFYNTETRTRFREDNVFWKYDAKKEKLVLQEKKLKNIPTNFAKPEQKPNDWKILCLVGGTPKGNKIEFNTTSIKRISSNSEAEAEGIYMSTKWLPLKYNAKTDHLSLTETIHLRNQCTMLLVRLGDNHLGNTVKLQAFRISANGLSFSGSMDLSNYTSDNLPTLQGDTRNSIRILRVNGDIESVAPNTKSSHYIVSVVPNTPQTKTTNLMVSALVGESWTRSVELFNQQFTNKDIKPNGYIGINNISSEPKVLEHPIEGLLAWENESNSILTSGTGNSNGAHTTVGYLTNEDGTYRSYYGATKYQLSALVPGLKSYYGGLFDPSIAFSILDFKQGRYHDTRIWKKKDLEGSATGEIEKEQLYVFDLPQGTEFKEFHAQYKHGGKSGQAVKHFGNVYYGIRYQDGEDNKYLSAYRYYRNGNNLEIRVRMLGPSRANTTLDQVANEGFWNKPLEWNQREWKRTIAKGGYWSTTTDGRGANTVHHAMKIFVDTSIDRLVAQPDGAYVTTNYKKGRKRFLEGNKPANNQFNYLLYTTDKKAKPKP